MDKDKFDKAKQDAFFSASYHAWFNTSLEKDKSLITLSTAGVGLLVTILTTGKIHSLYEWVSSVVGTISFLLCLSCTLYIFDRNKAQIENNLKGDKKDDKRLVASGKFAIFFFILGLISSTALGGYKGFASYKQSIKEQKMAEDKNEQERLEKSFLGLEGIDPSEENTSEGDDPNEDDTQSEGSTDSSKQSE